MWVNWMDGLRSKVVGGLLAQAVRRSAHKGKIRRGRYDGACAGEIGDGACAVMPGASAVRLADRDEERLRLAAKGDFLTLDQRGDSAVIRPSWRALQSLESAKKG